jgi:hypothetical protein
VGAMGTFYISFIMVFPTFVPIFSSMRIIVTLNMFVVRAIQLVIRLLDADRTRSHSGSRFLLSAGSTDPTDRSVDLRLRDAIPQTPGLWFETRGNVNTCCSVDAWYWKSGKGSMSHLHVLHRRGALREGTTFRGT